MTVEDHRDALECNPQAWRSTGIAQRTRKAKKEAPQRTIEAFWDKFTTKHKGKIWTVLPSNAYARTKAANMPDGVVKGHRAMRSYEKARAECVAAVEKIASECQRVNQKYRDAHFDIEFDLKLGRRYCLNGLTKSDRELKPMSVKRVTDIFDDPQFYIEGATATDVRQGRDGDCWFMAALCTLSNKEGLIRKVCVAKNEKVGVYGFVFYRDGEWITTIIDDKLYLSAADYDESVEERPIWEQINRIDSEEEYRKAYQNGSRALYFAQCSDANETWLPLLEKAYAKAHGDFNAIQGGFVGEAIEDLTGGVTTELFTTDILDQDKFWTDELMNVNKEFLFGCATGFFRDWLGRNYNGLRERRGIAEMHAYSIMEAKEINGERLLRLRNPWGRKEWNGPWSDGSEQWTPEWMNLLGHQFGNDGMFWISYKDLMRKYQHFDRTRLFGPEWTITQQWTCLDVEWSADYHETKFSIKLTKTSPVVIVLSQLDSRYFDGLEGQYVFQLQFRLEKDGEKDYIVRSHGNYIMTRSVSTDLELSAGTYSVLMKIIATRDTEKPAPEEVIKTRCRTMREKLLQIGLSYDLAHAKGRFKETEQEREERERKEKEAEKNKRREALRQQHRKEWQHGRKVRALNKRNEQGRKENARKNAEARKGRGLPIDDDRRDIVYSEGDKSTNGGSETDEPITAETVNGIQREVRGARSEVPPSQPEEHIKFFNENLDEDLDREVGREVVPSLRVNGFAAPMGDFPADGESDFSFESEFDSDLGVPPSVVTVVKEAQAYVLHGPAPDDDIDIEHDPWNAVCVVGLRVYSKDPALSVEIVRPKTHNDAEAPLDLDDPAAGATKNAKSPEGSVKGGKSELGV